ncbi:hypothetical protein F5Y17DRAFT_451425 [Xylariaceae sp. FL0594]|nr:hypothetical protein F5Y17DRAFT_451425 [Xylariaceae sp. FL0594]
MEVLSNQTRGMNLESDCEDNLCYGSQSSTNSYPLSRTYSESHGSVSSASSVRGPVTPNSGRSSPGVQHQSSFYSSPPLFGWTQESEYNTLYHKDDTIKMEGGQEPPYPDPGYHTPPQTGIRRGGIPGSTLEPVPYPSYQPVEPISTLVQDTPIHSTNASSQNLPIHAQQWGPYTYCESNDHHELDNPYLQACQSSRWSSHDSDNYLGPPFETAQPPSYPGLEKNTTELSTRTQPGFRVAKRNRLHPIRADDRAFTVYTKGTFRCLHENCTERRPFKRQEHLKRHVTT